LAVVFFRTFALSFQCYVRSDEEDEENEKSKGFRNRTIIKYENRIRLFSTPDKVFRYFATYKVATDDKGERNAMHSHNHE